MHAKSRCVKTPSSVITGDLIPLVVEWKALLMCDIICQADGLIYVEWNQNNLMTYSSQ